MFTDLELDRGGKTRRWRQRAPYKIDAIVVHHGGCDLDIKQINHHYVYNKGCYSIPYHFAYENGIWYQLCPVEWVTHHAPPYNGRSIALLIPGDYTGKAPEKALQAELPKALAYLCKAYDISWRGVLGHTEVKEGHTVCPGKLIHTVKLFREHKGVV